MKYKVYILFNIALLFICCPKLSFGQDNLDTKAPTLQVGLNGMDFTKGSLDAQLIMEIVAKKQNELKLLAIQNVFLSKVENAGGTIYSFTNNVVKELVLEKDQNVRSRKIIENTVNIVFVTAYLEYYLKTMSASEFSNFNNLAKLYGYSALTNGNISIEKFIKEVRKNNNDVYSDQNAVEFIALLLDMCSEVIRKDEKLKQLGLMQISYSSTYEYMNLYNKLQTKDCEDNVPPNEPLEDILTLGNRPPTQCNLIKVATNPVFIDMRTHLEKITNYIGLLNYIIDEFSFRNDKLEHTAIMSTPGPMVKTAVTLKSDIDNVNTLIKALIKSLSDKKTQDSVLRKELNNLTNIYAYLQKAGMHLNSGQANDKIASDILFTVYSEFLPLLKNQSYRTENYLEIITALNNVSTSIAAQLLTTNPDFKDINGRVSNFLLIAAKLYQFNKTTTISEYLKLIDDLGDIFPDDNIGLAINTVTTYIKDYTIVQTTPDKKEVLSFNVESFIMRLQNIKPHNLHHFQLNFTVGVNTSSFDQPVKLTDTAKTVRTLSHVSEKIGIKYKFLDKGFWQSRNPGETYVINGNSYIKKTPPHEPIISNMFILAYGSGILYNVINTKTNKEFNLPMVGLAYGITFSNALDVSIGIGSLIAPDRPFGKGISDAFQQMKYEDYWKGNLRNVSFGNCFYNIGFDIQFGEYYKALMEKRDANKTQKLLANAKKSE